MIIERTITAELKIQLQEYPTVTILRPRQFVKTTLVRHIFPDWTYVSLEDADARRYAEDDPRAFLKKILPSGDL